MGKKRRQRSYAVLGLLLALFVALAIAFLWYQLSLKPVSQTEVPPQIFVIKKGQSIDNIGTSLEKAGLIRSRAVFKLLLTQKGLSKKIQAGTFRLSPSMDANQILTELTHGTLDVWVTLLEGWRREEMASAINKAYEENGVTFDEAAFLELTVDKEGYLYPDTYLLPLSASSDNIVQLLTSTFTKKTASIQKDIESSSLSLSKIVTLASLVEREAKTDTSRKLVAGILLNRLEIGMPLQVDATLQFAKGFDAQDKTWWTPPVALDKSINSPYNTYQNPGLPPGPIASPSLSSIQAVVNPTPSDYLYYITGSDGQMYYAKTLEEHNKNIQNHL